MTLTISAHDARWTADLVPHEPLLLLMHGYGSNEQDLLGLLPLLSHKPTAVALRAPLPAQSGFAWFPISEPGRPTVAAAQAAAEAVLAWMEEHVPATTPVVLLGFSQGGLMVTQLLRCAPGRFVAGVVLSGFVVDEALPGDDELARVAPPVFFGRGTVDPIIGADTFLRASRWLATHTTLTEVVYPGLGHGITPQEMADVSEFLAPHLPS